MSKKGAQPCRLAVAMVLATAAVTAAWAEAGISCIVGGSTNRTCAVTVCSDAFALDARERASASSAEGALEARMASWDSLALGDFRSDKPVGLVILLR